MVNGGSSSTSKPASIQNKLKHMITFDGTLYQLAFCYIWPQALVALLIPAQNSLEENGLLSHQPDDRVDKWHQYYSG